MSIFFFTGAADVGVDVVGAGVEGAVVFADDGAEAVGAVVTAGDVPLELAAMEPNVLTFDTSRLTVGTAAGEDETGAETSAIEPKLITEASMGG